MKSRQDDETRRIVVGVDGFESSKAGLRWAIRQAKLTGAVVEAVTAWHVPVGTGWVPTADMPDYQEDAFTVLAEAIDEMCAVDPDVQVCPRVVEGRAGPVLVDAADGAELLVVGSMNPAPGDTDIGREVAHYMLRMRWNLRMSSLPASRAAPIAARHATASAIPVMCFIFQAFLVLRGAASCGRPLIPNPDQNYLCRRDPIGPKGGPDRDSGPGPSEPGGADRPAHGGRLAFGV